ncbi:MAG TPA: hypothetical protein VME69_03725 [Methylocella sp.]|nr:hypothetical protein [Methylocella sp.]
MLNVIKQVTELVRSENIEIGERRGVNHHDYNLKKSQALVALNRLSPLFAHLEPNPVLRAALLDMRRELEINWRLLDLQLRAARAVSDLITRAICEGQSDGTYSALPWKDDR